MEDVPTESAIHMISDHVLKRKLASQQYCSAVQDCIRGRDSFLIADVFSSHGKNTSSRRVLASSKLLPEPVVLGRLKVAVQEYSRTAWLRAVLLSDE